MRSFGPYTLTAGILLFILGIIGLVVPRAMSLATSLFLAWLLLIGGALWSYHTWNSFRSSFIDWLKPALLLISGALMLFYPASGVAAIGMLLAFYLLLDSFSSFAMASELRPLPGWGWMIFNAIITLSLALLFLIGWPATSIYLVGIYIAISLIFDGAVLIAIGWAMRKTGI